MLQTSDVEKHKNVNVQPVQKSSVTFLAIAVNKKLQRTSLDLVCVKCRCLECGSPVQNDLETILTF
jgi:hypothetical protein